MHSVRCLVSKNTPLACVAGRRAREGKGGIGSPVTRHAHSLRAVVFPFPSPSTPATQANTPWTGCACFLEPQSMSTGS